jgi:excisionase family DNA binding protein
MEHPTSAQPNAGKARARKLITVEEAAERCNIPVSTLYEMARQNRIGGVVRFGRRVRFDEVKLEAWIDSGGQALPGGWRNETA